MVYNIYRIYRMYRMYRIYIEYIEYIEYMECLVEGSGLRLRVSGYDTLRHASMRFITVPPPPKNNQKKIHNKMSWQPRVAANVLNAPWIWGRRWVYRNYLAWDCTGELRVQVGLGRPLAAERSTARPLFSDSLTRMTMHEHCWIPVWRSSVVGRDQDFKLEPWTALWAACAILKH